MDSRVRANACRAGKDLPLVIMLKELSRTNATFEPASGSNNRECATLFPSKSAVRSGLGLSGPPPAAFAAANNAAVLCSLAGSGGGVSSTSADLVWAMRATDEAADVDGLRFDDW